MTSIRSSSKVQSSAPRSPLKKAMRAKFGLMDAQPIGQVSSEDPLSADQLRTKLLRQVVALLERDDSMVDFVASVVDAVASQPLEQDTMRRAFLAQLNEAEGRKPVASSSGRVKKSFNVHHCRDFILACVNEIVDLDETDPTFDYAESCADSTSDYVWRAPKAKCSSPSLTELLVRPASPLAKTGVGFDYIETLSTPAPEDVASHLRRLIRLHNEQHSDSTDNVDDDDEDDEAFSKVHAYARSMAQKRRAFAAFKEAMPMEPSSPLKKAARHGPLATKRFVFNVLQCELPAMAADSPRKKSPLKELATKYNSFSKLKAHRNGSPTNWQRKQRALQQLKAQTSNTKIAVRPRVAPSWRQSFRDFSIVVLGVLLALAAVDEFQR
ncbi:hypothetical protein SDRG_14429 [Saprolegnia diclina VS20]|uniref:Uncharacterized protein n=1 Tax=Saprolegnia diclina (strain VS20) TaxID=1156394 RepID=T0R720_SAPDV|nr:hypothetical protein SDRG_14429 [Saprolegnia diclina VS20]EQC27848.1 hypothetical protein SDRG_14429 [Saprolegnia diclina VS20]|eukprot:XP_008618778.1 hypothetical protein SDRG_14429 [Saprolegnia diclina VS20]